MMRAARSHPGRWLTWAAMMVLLLSLAACSTRPERSVKVSDDWSRGQRLGFSSLLQPVGLAVEPDGQRVHLIWSGREAEGDATQLLYVQLDGQGDPLVRQTLPYLFLPRQARLAVASGGRTHLLAQARRNSASPDGIYYMLLGADGLPQGEAVLLSSPDQQALSYGVTSAGGGAIHVFWAQDGTAGPELFHQRLGPDGVVLTSPLRVAMGEEPSAQVAGDGAIHLAWLSPSVGRERRLLYAVFADGHVAAADGLQVGQMTSEGVGVRKPIGLALDDEQVYIFWSVEWRSGLSAGSAEATYVHFPFGRPQDARMDGVVIPEMAEAFDVAIGALRRSDAYGLSELLVALPRSMGSPSRFLQATWPVDGQRSELALALVSQVQFRRRNDTQVIVALFERGQLAAYQMAGRTGDLSYSPVLAADDGGHLHLAWVDYDTPTAHGVYYASTSPTVQARLNTRTAQDVFLGAANAAWGLMSGLSLLPLVAIILLPVVIWCGLFYIFGGDDTLTERGPAIAFGIALLIYFLGKLAVLSPVLMLPPALGLMPPWLRNAWPVLLLVIIAALTGLVFWRIYWRRAERPALFAAVLWFALVDAVLTVLVYGISFFGD